MNKVISTPIAIIIIVVLAILVGGIIIWQYLDMPKEEGIESKEFLQDETADWETYRNEEYGFEFKHSSNWYIKNKDQFKVYCQKNYCLESVSVENSNERIVVEAMETFGTMSPDHAFFWVSIHDDDGLFKFSGDFKSMNIGEKEIDVFVNKGLLYKNIGFIYKGWRYNISYGAGNEELVYTLDKILSTFRFIEKEIKKVSLEEVINKNSKIYRDKNHNFEIICFDKSICFLDDKNQNISISYSEIDYLDDYYIEKLSIELKAELDHDCEENVVSMATGAEGRKIVSENLTERGWPETLNINSSDFYRYFSVESSMGGKSIAEYGYKTLRNDICYKIILLVKGGNDLEAERVIREKIFFPILSTFRFIN